MGDLPDFLVIGAARAGTTALHRFLRQHPDVYMPSVKEPNFFAYEGKSLACKGPGADYINNSITELESYRALFSHARPGALKGEASPLYLFEPDAPANIARHIPKAKLVVVLRNPVEQAFSHYLYAVKQRIEPLDDFVEALRSEADRLAAGWQPLFGYSTFPRYGEQLARYFQLFPRDQFFIRTYEDFSQNQAQFLQELFTFLGVDPTIEVDLSERPNAGGTPKSRLIQDFLMKPNPITGAVGLVVPRELRWRIRDWLAGFNLKRGAEMPPEAREMLRERLSDDVARLGALLDRDFSGWLA